MKKKNAGRSIAGRITKTILGIIGLVLTAAVLMLGWLSVTEYKPKDTEKLAVQEPKDSAAILPAAKTGETYTLVTWNIGYGALGDNADFFMDGGKGVKTADKARLLENMQSMEDLLSQEKADFVFLQEIDRDSTRSEHLDETEMLRETLPAMETVFAQNFKVAFLPYPIPPIGKVDSGILTMSSIAVDRAERLQLPIPFSWPVSMANLKRCLLVTRIPVEGSDKELVLVNLHLEAFDDGEGKIAQARMLKEFLAEETAKGNYVIAGGDFNQTFSTVDPALYPMRDDVWHCGHLDVTEFDEGYTFLMDSSVPTCRSNDQPYAGADHDTFQYYMIDGFIVSENVRAVECTTIDAGFTATDHNPVRLKFMLD